MRMAGFPGVAPPTDADGPALNAASTVAAETEVASATLCGVGTRTRWRLGLCSKINTPVVEYFPAHALVSLRIINLKLDILCYSSVDFPVAAVVSELVIPGLADQLSIMKNAIVSELTSEQPQAGRLFGDLCLAPPMQDALLS
ncbi:hypothetical protein GUJ93_ZPchr0009g878 [Zizania palustris]|uniref:Uncharacterized protein n=1 Tax=Zizania palustris TaxID=103762 RepID=A0A8J5RKA1_ZIZPA|nr:hypothetical protein GUJ93_ZPchr0009g878 [Zizania palustris]